MTDDSTKEAGGPKAGRSEGEVPEPLQPLQAQAPRSDDTEPIKEAQGCLKIGRSRS
jgi:hypothetical protein